MSAWKARVFVARRCVVAGSLTSSDGRTVDVSTVAARADSPRVCWIFRLSETHGSAMMLPVMHGGVQRFT